MLVAEQLTAGSSWRSGPTPLSLQVDGAYIWGFFVWPVGVLQHARHVQRHHASSIHFAPLPPYLYIHGFIDFILP